MSAHDWPEFDQLMPNGKLLTEREFVGLTRAQYNYAKVRIDACAGATDEQLEGAAGKLFTGSAIALWSSYCDVKQQRDALQQRCEELVAEKLVLEDKLKMYKAFYDAN